MRRRERDRRRNPLSGRQPGFDLHDHRIDRERIVEAWDLIDDKASMLLVRAVTTGERRGEYVDHGLGLISKRSDEPVGSAGPPITQLAQQADQQFVPYNLVPRPEVRVGRFSDGHIGDAVGGSQGRNG